MASNNERAFIDFVVHKVSEKILMKSRPNVYNWESVKLFFSDFWDIRFGVKIDGNLSNPKDDCGLNSCLVPRLPYKIIENNGRKVMQFQIAEPTDVDDLSVKTIIDPKDDNNSCNNKLPFVMDSNYMEVLKVLFYEYFSLQKEVCDIEASEQWNYRFVLKMLMPSDEIAISYMLSKDSNNGGKSIDIDKLVNKFHLNGEFVIARLNLAQMEQSF